MVTKLFKIFLFCSLLCFLQSCPKLGEEVCDDASKSAHVPDLVSVTPLKPVYNAGDEVIFKLNIPSENNYFSNAPVNLYQKTGVSNGWYIASSTNLFDQNQVTYNKGSKKEGAVNWHNLKYNPANMMYELEIKVKLNRTGDYSIYIDDRVDFLGTPECNRYFIYTMYSGNTNKRIEFKVQ